MCRSLPTSAGGGRPGVSDGTIGRGFWSGCRGAAVNMLWVWAVLVGAVRVFVARVGGGEGLSGCCCATCGLAVWLLCVDGILVGMSLRNLSDGSCGRVGFGLSSAASYRKPSMYTARGKAERLLRG